MFKLKNTKIIAVSIVALCISFSSCKKFTELDPLSSLSENTAFSTPANIELAINGMNWQAAVGTYNGDAGRGYPFGGASIEQGDMRGEDMINLQSFFQITYENTYTVSSANNVNHWEQLYALINQCNVIIQGVEGAVNSGVISADIGDPYKGEALFLRALAHHELLIHFSRPYADNPTSNFGVPYRTIAVTSAEGAVDATAEPRGTVAEAYAKLLLDLDLAESILPENRAAGLKISRPTKGAAIALKTRIKLHQGDYPGVVAEGKKLGTDVTSASFTSAIGGYKLEVDPTVPFTNFTNNAESIYSVAQSTKANGGVNGAITSMYSPSALNGRDLIGVSPILYNASFWLKDDLRRKELTYKQTVGDRPYVYAYKYKKYGDNDDWNPILRYSEVLLNVAEAYAYDGNETQALRLLNAVRDRSVGASNSFGNVKPVDLKKAIYNERRVEFFAEGKRWADIHRLALSPYGTGGIPAKILQTQLKPEIYDGQTVLVPGQKVVPYAEKDFVWPIPQSELDANPVLRGQQNPGW